jgi:hypothetical protein
LNIQVIASVTSLFQSSGKKQEVRALSLQYVVRAPLSIKTIAVITYGRFQKFTEVFEAVFDAQTNRWPLIISQHTVATHLLYIKGKYSRLLVCD